MKNVYIYCEGPTEESFINEIIYPYLLNFGVITKPIICETKRLDARKFKGGVSSYSKIRKELSMLCKQHHNEIVTTMFDYYGMPEDTPGIDISNVDIYEQINEIEKRIIDDIGQPNCRFHLSLHEFEGLLFSNPSTFEMITGKEIVNQLQQIKEMFNTPEHINNSPLTAPSKRIMSLIPNYAKVRNGTLLAKEMGIDVIMENCKHFKEWMDWLKNI